MKTDKNKGITDITYNYLNLPTQIVWSATKKIDYLYNASGQKIQKKVTSGTTVYTTDYLDGFQYFNGTLQFFPHAEGYVKQTALGLQPTFDYVYNYTDHLGNVRLSYTKDPASGELKILDENHYYPFGLKHQKYTNPLLKDILANEEGSAKAVTGIDPSNPVLNIYSNYDYKYNYQEWQDEHALNMYAMDFRNYDPTIGRFYNPDLLAEIAPDWSPYRFAFDNPVFFSDPTGLCEDCPFLYWEQDRPADNSILEDIIQGYWGVNWSALADGDGQYYNEKGELIGDDGIDDDKAYVQDEDGDVQFGQGILVGGGNFSEIEMPNSVLNMQSMLMTIRTSEGHGNPVPYNMLYGGNTFDSYDQHPNINVSKWGKQSTAAGAYQFLSRTWNMHAKNLGLTDFSPFSQDRAAIAEIGLVKGATNLINNGDYVNAIKKLSGKWTSLPGGVHAWNGFSYNIFLQSRASILQQYKK